MKEKRQLHQKIIIGSVIMVKIVVMGLFSSDYQDKLFIPFVNIFLSGHNPYDYYYQNDLIESFPYFPLMLLIESVGGMLLNFFSPASIFIKNLLFKVPLLLFDLLGFYFIRKLNVRFKYAMVFYFCSPIIWYATYIHGQLDIIPTTLLIIAIYFLLDWKNHKNLFLYALFLGLSLSTKLHIMAAVPVLFFYVAKKKNYIITIKYHLITLLTVMMLTSCFWCQGFVKLVLLNQQQASVLTVGLDYGSTRLIIPVFVLTLMYWNVYELNYFNRNLLISMLTFLFGIFLVFTAPMPAWYIWMVPLLTIYYGYVEEDKYKVMVLYALFSCVYIIYFIFLHQTEYVDIYYLGSSLQYLKVENMAYKSIVFTSMVACMVVIIYKIYEFGIASNGLYQYRNKPFSIGIAGDSGTGKSKMIEKIEHLFGNGEDILFIEGDGDHRWERNDKNWERYTALDPQANYLYRQAADIHKLRTGNHVSRVEYNHNSGMFSETKRVSPKKYIVLCGLHSLYLPQLRQELDLKIYMNTDDELRKYWKIQRDMKLRGYSKESIVAQIERRLPDAEKYIYPQRQYADIVITYFDRTLENCYVDNHKVKLSVQIEFRIDMEVSNFVEEFRHYDVDVNYFIAKDMAHQILVFDGEQLEEHVVDYASIAESCIPQYADFFTYSIEWGKDVEGVIQLILLYVISLKMSEGSR